MLNSKLLEIWRCYSSKQMKRFGDFIKSPYHNKNIDLVLLYEYLQKYAPKFDKEKHLAKETVYQKALGKPYDAKQMGYYLSYLVKISEKFNIIDPLNEGEQEQEYNYHLLQYYNNNKLEKHYKSALKDAQTALQTYESRDAAYHHYQYLLEDLNNAHFDRKRRHGFDDSLQKAVDNLDIYFISKKLKYSCEIINRQNVVAGAYKLRFLDELLHYLNDSSLKDTPCIAIYHQILLTLLHSDKIDHFSQLKQSLQQHSNQFSKEESRSMYMYAVNHTIRKINNGNTSYQRELFDLYLELLDKAIIFDDGYLSPWTFKNIVSIAIRVNEFEWTGNFIEQYKSSIEPTFRENAYTFNRAYLLFSQGNYNEALQMLQQVEFTHLYYNIETKALMVKLYYELGESELLNAHIHAFKTYLKRNKYISASMKAIYLNLAEFIRQLDKIKQTPNSDTQKNALQRLKTKVQQTKKVADLNWLLKKINS